MFSARPQMTRDEQAQFVTDMIGSVARAIHNNIRAGAVPEHWGGIQLRLYIAECMERGCSGGTFASASDLSEYDNDVLVKGL